MKIWIRDMMKATLLFHRSVSANRTDVVVHGGVVTPSGIAISHAQMALTTEYVKDIRGVKDAVNEMPAPAASGAAPQSAGEMIDNSPIPSQVVISLPFHRSTSAARTMVTTDRDCAATLPIIARNRARKDPGAYPGVRIVIYKMSVE